MHLDDIQAGSAGPAHVDSDGFDQRTLGKVLDLLGHSGTEKQGLSLSLDFKKQKQIIGLCMSGSIKKPGYISKAQFS